MGCSTCAVNHKGVPTGCGNKGHCTSGTCNKMNTFDWLAQLEIHDPTTFDIVEVSFKNGSRKEFFKNQPFTRAITGDMVVVETGNGYNMGRISLSGDLVRLQLKKKRVPEDRVMHRVLRRCNTRDLEKLQEARALEHRVMVRARVIARTLDLEMKIGDVEYQGDLRKATFYYTAEGRVDFRELVRLYAKEFRVKVEMRQIGSRQESARIGGVGSCGRELCCSTWLSDFKSVTTSAARYQNIAINQSKLSGQCGRLKCCLNYELDTYMDALESYPKKVDVLKTKVGTAALIKIDIFKGLMYYAYERGRGKGPVITLDKERVREIKQMNDAGELPDELAKANIGTADIMEVDMDFADVTGQIELPAEKKRRKKRSKRRKGGNQKRRPGGHQKSDRKPTAKTARSKQSSNRRKRDRK